MVRPMFDRLSYLAISSQKEEYRREDVQKIKSSDLNRKFESNSDYKNVIYQNVFNLSFPTYLAKMSFDN